MKTTDFLNSRFIICIFFASLCSLLVGCKHGDGKPTLAVSVEPQRQLLEALVGDRYEVVTVLPRGANPETFEPTVNGRMAIDQAQLYFTIGDLPFEEAVAKSLSQSVKVVDSAQGITPIYGTHSHDEGHDDDEDDDGDHHHHGGVDPHKWASVQNARIIAANMAKAICEADPEGADTYNKNLAALDAQLAAADKNFKNQLADASHTFAIWHPSLSYFARDYGLEQVAVGFENKELSPRQLAEVSKHIADSGAKVLFMQQEYDARQSSTLTKMLGIKTVTINPLDYNWLDQLNTAANALTAR